MEIWCVYLCVSVYFILGFFKLKFMQVECNVYLSVAEKRPDIHDDMFWSY